MKHTPNALQKIVEGRLCTGCGSCAFANMATMHETTDENRRPYFNQQTIKGAEKVCPQLHKAPDKAKPVHVDKIFDAAWGPVLALYEGYAADPDIRHRGSSGGAVTAIALYAQEKAGHGGCLHVKASKADPTRNEAALSQNRDQLLEGSGSRYAPASICDRLDLARDAKAPCTIVGKPCDIEAAQLQARGDKTLAAKVGLTVSIFCAGTPSRQGTAALLNRLRPDTETELEKLDYRGEGWPGDMRAIWKRPGQKNIRTSIGYNEGWGEILQKYRQWRCHICSDHTGETADISVGDPWQRPTHMDQKGRSLIAVRTRRGLDAVKSAIKAGYLVARPVKRETLFAAQPNLMQTKGAVWGRSIALKTLGLAHPQLQKAGFICWLQLSFRAKCQSLFGTWKRILVRKLYRPKTTRFMPKTIQSMPQKTQFINEAMNE